MKGFLFAAIIALFFALGPAVAQDDPFVVTEPAKPRALGDVTDAAECFNVVNKAPYTVYGSINTNYFVRADGIKTRHKSNFRLESQAGAEFCTFGPFYDGHKLELVLRTLVPIFDCKTGINGDIIIYGKRKSEGGTETYAACL